MTHKQSEAMTKILLLVFMTVFTFSGLHGQMTEGQKKISTRQAAQFIRFENSAKINQANFVETHYQELGLQSVNDLQEKKTIQGLNGWIRIRMQQAYKGLRVVGASYILHQKDGQIKKSTGDLLPFIDLAIKPNLSEQGAKEVVMDYTNARLLSQTKGGAVVLPDWDMEQAELVVMDLAYPNFSGKYTLAYHVIISNLEGRNQYRESVYIDANTGKLIESISEIAHASVEGIANTFYYGQQKIITDSIAPNLFVLRDSTRGGGIITRNGSRADFEDDDNFWNNFGHKEEVGTDAHYCASSYYDFMVEDFNWVGLDGEGFNLESRVYGDERNDANAIWDGSVATFYGGDCDEWDPLTTFDVVGHEFAHGFTDFTSDLIYRDEAGALNESISDIFGKALEYRYDFENFTWFIGRKSVFNGDGYYRDMSNPLAKNHPKFYVGEQWATGSNPRVHTNSGVMNFWFYLLSDGQADVNEVGYAYDVKPIGIVKATAIVFTMNVAYLTSCSNYSNAVTASIEAAKDLYGENSTEVASVIEAWKAVGLRPESGDYNIRVELLNYGPTVCADEIDAFPIEIYLINDGRLPYMPGDIMNLTYVITNDTISQEELILSEVLLPKDTLLFTFSQLPNMLEQGKSYNFWASVEATAIADPNSSQGEFITLNNKTATGRMRTTELVGLDVSVFSVFIFNKNSCQLQEENTETSGIFGVSIRNLGCEDISIEDIPFTFITASGLVYHDTIRQPVNLLANVSTTRSTQISIPEEIANGDSITVRVNLPNDINPDNNEIKGQYSFLETVINGYEEDFTVFELSTSKVISIAPASRADIEVNEVDENSMLIITGTRNNSSGYENCGDLDLFFRENNLYKTNVNMCVNTVEVLDPVFSFDLIQYRADDDLENIDPAFASMVQVTVGGKIYPIIADQPEGVSMTHEFSLPDDFSDGILIKALTLRGDGADASLDEGDFVLIDNIRITSGSVSTNQTIVEQGISVFPNPSDGIFNFVQELEGDYDLTIYDGLGRMIYQAKEVNSNTVWDASQADGGIYFFEVQTKEGNVQQGKLVVSH